MTVAVFPSPPRFAAVLALTAALSSCKNEEQVQYPETQSNQAAWSGAAGAQSTGGFAGTAGAQATAGTGAAAGGAPAAAPAPLDAVSLVTLKASLDERAKTDAKQMQPIGQLFSGQLNEGEAIQADILLEPKKCYSVVASGGPGIAELDIQITAAPGPNMPAVGPVLAVDNSAGALASITPCYKNEYPMPVFAKIIVKSTRGAGPAAAQAYVK